MKNKRTKIQTGVARARLLLKRDLAWLPGYPLSKMKSDGEAGDTLPWQSDLTAPGKDSPIGLIDGEHLRRAQMTISKLCHRFPRALPKIVDDVDDWLRRIDLLFDLLKGFIHHGQAFTSDDVMGRDFLKRRVAELAIDLRVCDKTDFLQRLLDEFEDEMSVRQKFTIAVNVDSSDVSRRLLSQLRWSEVVGLVNQNQCNECDVFHGIAEYSRVFDVLVDFHPSLALRAIRASRPSSIKSDVNDLNRTRRDALAKVHRMLGREQLGTVHK